MVCYWKIVFNKNLYFQWNYFPSYPANGSVYWTYPIALNKVLNLNCCNVFNSIATNADGGTRIRTYTITNANFSSGFSSNNVPLFCFVIGI